MNDRIITSNKLQAFQSQAKFTPVAYEFYLERIKCFYCDGDNDCKVGKVNFCQFCNGPMEDGYKFVGICRDNKLYLNKKNGAKSIEGEK